MPDTGSLRYRYLAGSAGEKGSDCRNAVAMSTCITVCPGGCVLIKALLTDASPTTCELYLKPIPSTASLSSRNPWMHTLAFQTLDLLYSSSSLHLVALGMPQRRPGRVTYMSLILFGPSQVNSDIYVTNLWRIQKTRQSFWWSRLQSSDTYVTHLWMTYMSVANDWHMCHSISPFFSDIYVTHWWVTYMSLFQKTRHSLWVTGLEWHICHSFLNDIYVSSTWVTYMSLFHMTRFSLCVTGHDWHICHSCLNDIYVSSNRVTYMSVNNQVF